MSWCVKYGKGDLQSIHNHRGWGFSGILYVEFDPIVHFPTCFMAPWNDPKKDTTLLTLRPDRAGQKGKIDRGNMSNLSILNKF